jgi:hypothetical protein
MHTPKSLFNDIDECELRLESKFGITKNDLIEVVKQTLLARSDVTSNHPINAKGTYSYQEGTRYLRELLIPKGWKNDYPNGLEAVTNQDGTISLVFQNATHASDPITIPQSISKKGPGCKKAIQERMGDLFQAHKDKAEKEVQSNNMLWFFCVAIKEVENQIFVSAELLCPERILDQHFEGFVERIAILRDENMSEISLPLTAELDYTAHEDTLEIEITKK